MSVGTRGWGVWGVCQIHVLVGEMFPSNQTILAMAAPCPLHGDGVTDNTLLHIVRFLTSSKDLIRLQLTCPRFAAKVIAAPSGEGGGGAAPAPEMLCIPEEAARRWVAGCSDQERDGCLGVSLRAG